MDDLDGQKFIALEDEFIGDGVTDATTQPLSAYKEQRINSNTKFLARTHQRVAQTPWVDRGAPRKVGLNDRAVQYIQMVELHPNDDRLTVRMVGEVTGELVIRCTIYPVVSGGVVTSHTLGRSVTEWSETSESDEHLVEVFLESDTLVAPQLCLVALSTQARETAGPSLGTINPENVDWDRDAYAAVTANAFTRAELENSRVELTRGDDRRVFDIIAVKRNFDDGDTWIALHPLDKNTIPSNFQPPGSWDLDIVPIPYIEPISWWMEVETDPAASTDHYSAKTQAEMLPQQPVVGQHVSKHPANFDSVAFRRRIVAAGPSHTGVSREVAGEVGDGNVMGFGWGEDDGRPRWTYSQADSEDLMDTFGFRIDHKKAEVRVDGLISVVDINAHSNAFLWDMGDKATDGAYPEMQDDSIYNRWLAEVPLRFRITQLEDGDESWAQATEIAEEEIDVSTRTWLISPSVHRPFLRSMSAAFAAQWEGNFTLQDEPYRTQSEGMLVEPVTPTAPTAPRHEFRYFRTFTVTMELDELDWERPFRMEIYSDEMTTSNFSQLTTTLSTSGIVLGNMQVLLAHHTVSVRAVG